VPPAAPAEARPWAAGGGGHGTVVGGSHGVGHGVGHGGALSASTRAEDELMAEGLVWEERDTLLRALLDTLPQPTLAALAQSHCATTIEVAAQLTSHQLRAIGAAQAVRAAKLAKRAPARRTSLVPGGAPAADLDGDGRSRTISPATLAWQKAAAAATAATRGDAPPGHLREPPPSFAPSGGGAGRHSGRLDSVTDLSEMQQLACVPRLDLT
jgi:hypothetical protein